MTLREAMIQAERCYWAELIAKNRGKVDLMALEAGTSRSHAYKRLGELGLPLRRPRADKHFRKDLVGNGGAVRDHGGSV